jgi:hypothetical protein
VLAQSAVTIQGRIVDAGGQPAGEAVMALVQAADSRPFRTGQADSLGHFYFGNLPQGSYRVYAWNAAMPGAEAEGPLTTGGLTVLSARKRRAFDHGSGQSIDIAGKYRIVSSLLL